MIQNRSGARVRVPWWRRIYVINPDFQIRFARSAVIIGVFSSVLSAGLLLWSFWAFNIWQGQRLPPPVVAVICSVFFLNVMGIYVAGVLATQKIAGPMYNLIRQFQRVGKGDFLATARFREGDEMHYVARSFNEMISRLASRNETIFLHIQEAHTAFAENQHQRVKEALEKLMAMHEPESDGDIPQK